MLHLNVARHFGGKQTKLGNRVLIALIDGQKTFEIEKNCWACQDFKVWYIVHLHN